MHQVLFCTEDGLIPGHNHQTEHLSAWIEQWTQDVFRVLRGDEALAILPEPSDLLPSFAVFRVAEAKG
jgi:hypothetical protein